MQDDIFIENNGAKSEFCGIANNTWTYTLKFSEQIQNILYIIYKNNWK